MPMCGAWFLKGIVEKRNFMAKRIYADFNGLGPSLRNPNRLMVPLDTWGSLRDLMNAWIRLREGTTFVIYDQSDETEDLEADVSVFYDAPQKRWIAEISDAGIRYVPRQPPEETAEFMCWGCRKNLANEPGFRTEGSQSFFQLKFLSWPSRRRFQFDARLSFSNALRHSGTELF